MTSNFESGRFDFTSSSHSSRKAISELFDIHHEHVRPELLQGPGKFLAICVLGNKGKKIKVPLRIAHHAFEIVDLKQAQIAMIVLDAFLLKLRALLSCELISLAFLLSAGCPFLVIFQKRFAIVRAPAIWPSGQFHLQYAEIDSQLQFLAAIQTSDLAHFNAATLVWPILQQRIEIQTHRKETSNISHCLVNKS